MIAHLSGLLPPTATCTDLAELGGALDRSVRDASAAGVAATEVSP